MSSKKKNKKRSGSGKASVTPASTKSKAGSSKAKTEAVISPESPEKKVNSENAAVPAQKPAGTVKVHSDKDKDNNTSKKTDKNPEQANAKKKSARKAYRDREITIILSAILLALTIAGIILFFVMPDPNATYPSQFEVSDIPGDDTANEGTDAEPLTPDNPDEPAEPEIIYPAPQYAFTEEPVYIEIPGIDREYTIAWVSDVHIISDFEAGDVYEGSLETVLNRYETLSVTPDGVHAADLWPEIIDYLNYNNFDGVIFGGDLLDYCSTSNMDILTEGFERLRYPSDRVLYIRADHDYGTWYSDGSTGLDDYSAHDMHVALDGDDNSHKYLDFGDFIIAGVNNSIKKPGEEQMEVLTELYSSGVPVIAATHVPYYSENDPSLEELSMQVRNRIYYWSPNGETYVPDADMQRYLNLIYSQDSSCAYVLAGHLHAPWDGEIRDGLRQHIFTPAFAGAIGIIHIVPAE
ncbi:MAG: hypothetical protein K5871_08720 [Lachnospiraceae bacterium]|nr:hypothetical protein [Lachnospiraceae bacterium]